MRILMVMLLIVWGFFIGIADADILYVTAGQSNARGQGVTSELLPEVTAVPANVEFWNQGLRVYDLNEVGNFGPEASIMQELSTLYPDERVVLVKWTVNGTQISLWCPERIPEDYADEYGTIYQAMISEINTHMSTGIRIGGLIWTQGEADTRYMDRAKYYKQRLQCLVNNLRTDLGSPDMPIFYVLADTNTPYTYTVNQAQISAGKMSGYFPLSPKGLTKKEDLLHYDTQGQLTLGDRYSSQIRQHKR